MTSSTFIILSAAVFLGAFVSGLAGFAFSAVAGALLLHVLPPIEAIPLMMVCSVAVQATNLWALRDSIAWKESLTLVIGGVLGAPLAIWLLQTADARILKEGFGALIAIYAAYMLLRPSLTHLNVHRRDADLLARPDVVSAAIVAEYRQRIRLQPSRPGRGRLPRNLCIPQRAGRHIPTHHSRPAAVLRRGPHRVTMPLPCRPQQAADTIHVPTIAVSFGSVDSNR
jgi:hypothetical protein